MTQPIFSPPLYVQRHQFVIDYVLQKKPQKVVDLGCGECQLLRKLKFRPEISLLVGVDINGALVKQKKLELGPLAADYLQPRDNQLRVELYQGSVTQKDSRLRGFDLVTSIELIEHLTPDDVESFTGSLFGYMKPAAVIVSTPNCEYNPLLPGLVGFRHRDHKFEWTRAEFRTWALKVCCDHGYEVELTGVGQAPPGQQERVGFCSQIAVFHRLSGRDCRNVLPGHKAEDLPYTMMASLTYPSLRDSNVMHGLLLSEVLSCAKILTTGWSEEKRAPFLSSQAEGDVLTEVKNPPEQLERVVSEDEANNVLATISQNTNGQCDRSVSLPLELLWSRCPKIRVLCGSLSNLRSLLMDQPKVTLNHDGSALIVNFEDQGQDEEEVDEESEGGGCAEARKIGAFVPNDAGIVV